MAGPSPSITTNQVLAALDGEALRRVEPSLEEVDLERRDCLFTQGEPIEYVYFPLTSVLSLVSEMSGGRVVEVATVGREGMVGVPIFLQVSTVSSHMGFCQVPGTALRMRAADLPELADALPDLHRMLQRYTQALISQMARNAGCNMVHSVEQRAARWLLTTGDRQGSDSFDLTQEFLAQMLGATRGTVNELAQRMQAEGLISYRRGYVQIVDTDGLQERSCECYELIARELEHILGTPEPRARGSEPSGSV